MSKKIIFIDCDDVLFNTIEAWVKALNHLYGLNKTLDDIKEWDMTKNFPELTLPEILTPL